MLPAEENPGTTTVEQSTVVAKHVKKSIVTESARADMGWGSFSLIYSLAALTFAAWIMFDTWMERYTLATLLGYNSARLGDPLHRLILYSILGGAVGGSVNSIRSIVQNFKKFDRFLMWKYIAAPWMGGTLGIIVYALLHSSMAVLGSTSQVGTDSTTASLANFAVGVLSGYGARDVFIWLDTQVMKLFKTEPDVKPVVEEKQSLVAEAVTKVQETKQPEVGKLEPAPQPVITENPQTSIDTVSPDSAADVSRAG